MEICTAPNAIMLSEKKYSAMKNCFHLHENQEHTKLTMDGDRNQDSDCLEKEMATHSRILAWKIPWTEEAGGLQSMGLQKVEHD